MQQERLHLAGKYSIPRRAGTRDALPCRLTCSLWTLSLSSARARSPSLHFDCSSCSCTSSFFFLCSTSCLAWFRTRSSPARSAFSFSSVCLFLSRLALAWPEKQRGGKALQLWPGERCKVGASVLSLPPAGVRGGGVGGRDSAGTRHSHIEDLGFCFPKAQRSPACIPHGLQPACCHAPFGPSLLSEKLVPTF